MHIKEHLLLIGKSSLCGGSGFPLSLSEWSFTICLTPYNRKINVLSTSLNKTFPHFLPFKKKKKNNFIFIIIYIFFYNYKPLYLVLCSPRYESVNPVKRHSRSIVSLLNYLGNDGKLDALQGVSTEGHTVLYS